MILDGIIPDEIQDREDDIVSTCKPHHVKLVPMYYSFGLVGRKADIEAVTMELWGMPADQWEENCLSIIEE